MIEGKTGIRGTDQSVKDEAMRTNGNLEGGHHAQLLGYGSKVLWPVYNPFGMPVPLTRSDKLV